MDKKFDIISNEKIVELYNAGWSINDIVAQYRTGVRRVRCVLQERGVDTSRYRAASPFLRECLAAMVIVEWPVQKIADRIDVSVHLIRQVLRDNGTNTTTLRLETPGGSEITEYGISEKDWKKFCRLYRSGDFGFFKCAEQCGFSVSDCVEGLICLSDRDVKQHRDKLRRNIAEQSNSKLSPSSVAKRFGVSTAIVKKIFSETKKGS